MSTRSKIILMAGVLLFFGLAVLAQHQADATRASTKQDYMYLPNKTILKHFTAGMNPIIADLLWLECIQYTGRALNTTHDFKWIEQMVSTATALDPHFIGLYQFGGMFLASLNEDGDAAISILEEGIQNNPGSWELPYEVAMVYLLNRSEDPNSKCRAQYYVAMALSTGQSADFVGELYEGLKVQCETQNENPCDDLAFEAQTYQRLFDTGKSVMQDVARQKMELLQLRKSCCDLMAMIEEYQKLKGVPPTDLNELVDAKILGELPQDPKGGTFFIDTDGVVKNTTVLDEQVAKFKGNIEAGLYNYHRKNGTYPATLTELMESHIMSYFPTHPYASKSWEYDALTGKLK